jgi:hypothetical protein
METKQEIFAVRKETGKRLRAIRREKKWDDVINELINCFLRDLPSISVEADDFEKGKCEVTGLEAFEIRKGDIVNLYHMKDEESDIEEHYAIVKERKDVKPNENNPTATMFFELIEI